MSPARRRYRLHLDLRMPGLYAQLAAKRPRHGPKIVCVGYQKTGTTSIGAALVELGFRHKTFDERVHRRWYNTAFRRRRGYPRLLQLAARHDSFDDLPWSQADVFPLLDERFPGSRFVLSVRDSESWARSFEEWSLKHRNRRPDMTAALAEYHAHNAAVLEYFSDRPDDLLVLELGDPDAFTRLGQFVGRPAPRPGLPHLNPTAGVERRRRPDRTP